MSMTKYQRGWGFALTLISILLMMLLSGAVPAKASAPSPAQRSDETCSVSGRTDFEPIPDNATPVVLTHGWTGDISDLKVLGEQLEQLVDGELDLRYFDYYAHSVRWAAEPQVADCLAEYIHKISAQAGQPVIVVAHSMGGLAIRFASSPEYATQPVTSREVSEVVTIATPHRGSPWGGTMAAEAVQTWDIIQSYGAMPHRGDAATCLARHDNEAFINTGCAIAPYLPEGVNLTQVEGANKFSRKLFNYTLWTLDHRGDGIVLTDSATGYVDSAAGPGPNGRHPTDRTVMCDEYDSDGKNAFASLLQDLDENLFSLWLKMLFSERATMDSINAGTLDEGSGTAWAAVAVASQCSHTNIVVHSDTAAHVAEVINRSIHEAPEPEEGWPDLSAFAGSWEGPVDQEFAPSYSVQLTIDPNTLTGEVTYPELSCGGTWDFHEQNGNTTVFKETITYGSRCVPETLIRLTARDDGSLDYSFDDPSRGTSVLVPST